MEQTINDRKYALVTVMALHQFIFPSIRSFIHPSYIYMYPIVYAHPFIRLSIHQSIRQSVSQSIKPIKVYIFITPVYILI